MSCLQDHIGLDAVPHLFVGQPHHAGTDDRRVLLEHRLDLGCRHPVALVLDRIHGPVNE